MKLIRKTTIHIPSDLHARLKETARRRHVSLAELVRSACKAQYDPLSTEEKLHEVERLRRLSLPVGSVAKMKRQSVPHPRGLRK